MPAKISWLRPDSLAILLSLANISAKSRTLVLDGTGGLVAGDGLRNWLHQRKKHMYNKSALLMRHHRVCHHIAKVSLCFKTTPLREIQQLSKYCDNIQASTISLLFSSWILPIQVRL